MNAAILETSLTDSNRSLRPAPPRNARCPHCDSIIYSRRHKLCGLCGEELPAALIFNEAQANGIERLMQRERERHRKWMTKPLPGFNAWALA